LKNNKDLIIFINYFNNNDKPTSNFYSEDLALKYQLNPNEIWNVYGFHLKIWKKAFN